MKKRMLALLLCLCMVLSLSLGCFAEDGVVIGTASAEKIAKYGNLLVDVDLEAFEKQFAYGDVLSVEFLGQKVEMPFCPAYSYVDNGCPVAIVDDGVVKVAINSGDFATTYKIATKTTNEDKTFFWTCCEGVEDPVEITFRMAEKEGYYDEFVLRSISYTNERGDYPDLTDEQFANFRMITTPGIANGTLYRLASPVDPEKGRNTYNDAALKNAGVKTILNMADKPSDLEGFEGYADSYYATINHIELNMGIDATSADFKKSLGEGLKFLLANEGPYAFNCKEGKDRTGFFAALLEALMGADFDALAEDYLVSFYNLYGIEKDSAPEQALKKSFAANLQSVFGVKDAKTADLKACAEKYLKDCGLSSEEIASLREKLSTTPKGFADVKMGDFFHDAVKWAAQNEITSGVDKRHFAPYAPVTRAEVVTFLWRAADCPVPDYYMQMTDVESGSYYSNAVRWALAEKITAGTSKTTFSPDAPCTRAQIVTFLFRFAKAGPSGAVKSRFIDVLTSDYFWDAVYWADVNGITSGTSATTFGPNATCTRAQAVTFLYRLMNAENKD